MSYASKNVPSLRKEEVWKSAFCGSYLFSSSPSLSSFTQSASLTITITPEYKCASSKPSKPGKFDVKDDFLSRPLVSPVSNALMLLFINGFDKLSHKFNNMVQPTPIMPWNSPSSPHTHLVETYSNLSKKTRVLLAEGLLLPLLWFSWDRIELKLLIFNSFIQIGSFENLTFKHISVQIQSTL